MIINLPSKENFDQLAQDCLVQTLNNLYQIVQFKYPKRDDDDPTEDEVWTHHSGDLRTCLVLVYQAVEFYLKAQICEESPLLLIDNPRHDWPTNPKSADKDFSELYTIAGEQLIRTFNGTLYHTKQKEDINALFNHLRIKRNKIIHSITSEELKPGYLIEACLTSFTLFEGLDEWWNILRDRLITHPLFLAAGDTELEEAEFIYRLNFIMEKTSIKFLSKQSKFNLTARKYYCPTCVVNLREGADDIDESFKWAILNPNTPESVSLYCYNCQSAFKVERLKCNDCKGNVTYKDQCLSCLGEESGSYRHDFLTSPKIK
jgi:hypothetical protein